jgi:hypothetical protein
MLANPHGIWRIDFVKFNQFYYGKQHQNHLLAQYSQKEFQEPNTRLHAGYTELQLFQ